MHSSMQQGRPAAPPARTIAPVANPKPPSTDGDARGSLIVDRETDPTMVDSVSIPFGVLTLASAHCITSQDAEFLTADFAAAFQVPTLTSQAGLRSVAGAYSKTRAAAVDRTVVGQASAAVATSRALAPASTESAPEAGQPHQPGLIFGGPDVSRLLGGRGSSNKRLARSRSSQPAFRRLFWMPSLVGSFKAVQRDVAQHREFSRATGSRTRESSSRKATLRLQCS